MEELEYIDLPMENEISQKKYSSQYLNVRTINLHTPIFFIQLILFVCFFFSSVAGYIEKIGGRKSTKSDGLSYQVDDSCLCFLI